MSRLSFDPELSAGKREARALEDPELHLQSSGVQERAVW